VRLDAADRKPRVLTAGLTVTTAKNRVLVKQQAAPDADKQLSWRLGYINFDNVPLEQAVAEFNRYTERQIVIEDSSIAPLRVGGNFKVGNTQAFVWMLQNGFPIEARESESRITLRHR